MANLSKHKQMARKKSWQETAETWREKIKVSNIITRLEKHANGEVEMTPTQVKAAQVLLDRVMPTLSASEITRKNEQQSPEQLIQMLRERYGDEFANMLVKDYTPEEDKSIHEPGHV